MVNDSDYKSIVVASHRRSGTHWTIDSIRHNFPTVNDQFLTLERILPGYPPQITIDEFKSHLDNTTDKVIIKTHLAPFEVEKIAEPTLKNFIQDLFEQSKIVYVVRDGRDVLNSLFYYVKSFSKKEVTYTEFLKQKIGKNSKVNRIEYWKFHAESWLAQSSDIYTLKYESLAHDFNEIISELEKYLEIPRSQEIYKPELKKRGSSAVSPRKGVVGDYKQNFSEEDLAFFNQTAGDLLKNLGYE